MIGGNATSTIGINMKDIKLIRTESSEQGTFGVLTARDFEILTLELPWRDNQRNISRIPAGDYRCDSITSNRFGPCWWVRDVPGRSEILFHCGNLAGDREQGLRTDTLGCILFGSYRGILGGQQAVMASRRARHDARQVLGNQGFTLEIAEVLE